MSCITQAKLLPDITFSAHTMLSSSEKWFILYNKDVLVLEMCNYNILLPVHIGAWRWSQRRSRNFWMHLKINTNNKSLCYTLILPKPIRNAQQKYLTESLKFLTDLIIPFTHYYTTCWNTSSKDLSHVVNRWPNIMTTRWKAQGSKWVILIHLGCFFSLCFPRPSEAS